MQGHEQHKTPQQTGCVAPNRPMDSNGARLLQKAQWRGYSKNGFNYIDFQNCFPLLSCVFCLDFFFVGAAGLLLDFLW